MSKRPAKPANMPWLTPHLTVRDPGAAIDFYQRAFGFEKRMMVPGPDGKPMHVEMAWREGVIMFGPEQQQGCPAKSPASSGTPAPISLYVYCDDVDKAFARAKDAGAEVVFAPTEMFWGDRLCTVRDPDGYLWSFATNVADFDPKKAPGC